MIRAWLEAVPPVAREMGEDLIADTATACLGFASRTSGAVIERILATAPTAARRLGDAGLFRSWLRFLEHVLARPPRALRPMLEHLGELFDVLTLGGLRRRADWGIEAHRTDLPGLEAYFARASEASRAVLQAERKGVLLVGVHRRLSTYLRALWGRAFVPVPTAGDFEICSGLSPFVAEHALHLPDALDDWQGCPALDLYRAPAADLAAYLATLRAPIPAEGLNGLRSACVGLIEDARAETPAIRRFPNLRRLWAPFHAGTAPGTAGILDRVARAALTGAAEDALSAWLVAALAAADLEESGLSLRLGLALADRLRGLSFSAQSDRHSWPYRCDNRLLWEFEELDRSPAAAAPAQVRKYVGVSKMVNGVEVETAGEAAQEIRVQASELCDDGGTGFNDHEGKPPLGAPVPQEEFDHRIQMVRPARVTRRETRPRGDDPGRADAIPDEVRPITERLRHLMDALRPQGAIRIRRLEDGDELDLIAAVPAAIDTRLRRKPHPRVMMRVLRRSRDSAVLRLLDLSESTNDPAGRGQTVLGLTQVACLVLAQALHRVGGRFAIHGFCPEGRESVFYTRLKDFEQDWGALPKARSMGAEGRLSTRMGAAIRHATAHLAGLRAARKLMLVLTDGEPADIDVRDRFYLRHDARHAVEAAVRSGVTPFCLTLDPRADAYAQRIFGPRNVQVPDRVERLPERLSRLYASLTR